VNGRAGRDPRARADAYDSLIVLGVVRGTAEGLEAATEFARRAITARERAFGSNDLQTARSLSTLATVLDYRGAWTEAEALERRSLAIRRAAVGERDTLVAMSLRQLGAFAFWQGRPAEAESLFRSALSVYGSSTVPAPKRTTDLWLNLSEALRVQERYDEALDALKRGLAVADSSLARDDAMRAALVTNLAGLYRDQGRFLDAEPLVEEALALLRASEGHDPDELSTAELNLAEVYRMQGRLDEAAPLYQSALAGARRTLGADNPRLLFYLNQTAVFQREHGDLEGASRLAAEALGLLERTVGENHPLTAQSVNDLAELELAAGHAEAADSLARRAIAIRERTRGPAHVEVAISRLMLARALAADGSAPPGAASAELSRATAVLDTSRVEPEARLSAAELVAELAERDGRPAAARSRIERAVADAESLRVVRGASATSRASFLARYLRLYDRLFQLRLADADVAGAFEIHERARARLMLDQLSSAGVDFYSGLDPALAARLRAAEDQARRSLVRVQSELAAVRLDPALEEVPRRERESALEASRDSAAAEVERGRDAARAASPLWRQRLTQAGQPASLEEIQRELVAPDEYLVVYHLGTESSALILIPPAPVAPRAFTLVADPAEAALLRIAPGPLQRSDVAAIVDGGRTSRGSRIGLGLAAWLSGIRNDPLRVPRPGESDTDSTVYRLHALHRVLVPDVVWQDLKRARAVTLLVDGALHALPFETLVTASPGKSPRDWLDQGPPLRYGSSATSLLMLARRASPASPADAVACLSVSNPDFGSATSESARGQSWSPLPGTERESEAVRAAFAPKPVTVLSRDRATEAAVRASAGHVPYLHLATHGFVTERRGDVLAGVVLAKPDSANAVAEDDGLLQIYEIYDLKLGAKLAVLSACETQRGPAVEGEGVFALSRAFLVAGARTVIATQWPVDDEATADLVGDCFRRIARDRKPTDPTVSLRDAKRALRSRADRRDPFYWAAFTLSGTGRTN
jgi:tetratricopeptide (TPR) repeat protein